MLILDTDHLTEFQKGTSVESRQLNERLRASGDSFCTTIISVEEIMRGWMASIRRTTDPLRQIKAYSKLRKLFQFFATWDVLDWNTVAVAKFVELRSVLHVRIGTMDLKIASIALANNATLLF
jgi:tRNA(fMet)-specific endonuclease VapC